MLSRNGQQHKHVNLSILLIVLSTSNCMIHAFSTPRTVCNLRTPTQCHRSRSTLSARRNNKNDEDDYYYYEDENNDYDDDDEEEEYYEERRNNRDNLDYQNPKKKGLNIPSPFGMKTGLRLPSKTLSDSLLAGIFILGIGTGVTIDSQINTNPRDLASRDAIDQAAPNPNLCTNFGATAMAFDQRVFVSFNPFNVYVTQADVKPGCVLRRQNVVPILRDGYGLLNDGEVRGCKRNDNTWAFVGELGNQPQLSCVYQSDDAQNEFLSNPKLGIGEDVYDDDRARMVKNTKKDIKKMTQKQGKDSLGVGSDGVGL